MQIYHPLEPFRTTRCLYFVVPEDSDKQDTESSGVRRDVAVLLKCIVNSGDSHYVLHNLIQILLSSSSLRKTSDCMNEKWWRDVNKFCIVGALCHSFRRCSSFLNMKSRCLNTGRSPRCVSHYWTSLAKPSHPPSSRLEIYPVMKKNNGTFRDLVKVINKGFKQYSQPREVGMF
jgi:hypothetical protein